MALVVSVLDYAPFCVERFVSIKIDIFKAHLQQEMMVNLTSLSLNFDHLKNDETDCSNCLMSKEEAPWLSGRVLGLRVQASPASLCCVLEQDTLILRP